MKRKYVLILLTLIISIGAVLRLWQLGNVPPSPDWDEAALGYNALSVLQTGRDEHGAFMPIILQSFGDYKPALYMYLAIPSVALFGLDTFSVRLPSAIFGILALLGTYFLVSELFSYSFKNNNKKPLSIFFAMPLVTTALLAFSPWHIQFSRVAFETNIGLTLNIFGALFFLKGLKKPWLLVCSAICFALSMYAYHSERVFVPLLVTALFVIYWKKLILLQKKYLIGAVMVGIIVMLPLVQLSLIDDQVFARAKGVSVFSEQTPMIIQERERLLDDKENNDLLGTLIHNRRVVYAKEVVLNYTSHFNLNWLFITGDLERHHAPNMGILYLWELPFLLIGFYMLLFANVSKHTKLFIFAWLLIAPIPASITKDVPHAVRTLNFLPTFQIITAFGLLGSIAFMLKYRVRVLFYMFLFGMIVFNVSYFLNQYFVQQNYFFSKSWQYGYAETVSEVNKVSGEYDKIIISDVSPMDQSYIFFLYHLRFSPQDFQSRKDKLKNNFAKYEFRRLNWDTDKNLSKTLLIGEPGNFPEDLKPLKTIYYLDGKPAINIVGIK